VAPSIGSACICIKLLLILIDRMIFATTNIQSSHGVTVQLRIFDAQNVMSKDGQLSPIFYDRTDFVLVLYNLTERVWWQ
jgi:hypothetical protein